MASAENDLVVLDLGHHLAAGGKLARQNQLRQWVFDPALNRSLQRPRTINRVVTHGNQLIQRLVAQLQLQLTLHQALAQPRQLDLGNAGNLITGQWLEKHPFVETVDELRTEKIGRES